MRTLARSVFRHLAALGLALMACSAGAAEPLNVVASFSLLGDLVQRVGGERVAVHSLVGQDADAHVYQPTPADAKTIARASLVVVNGYAFEGWIERLIKSSGYRGKVLIAGDGVRTIKRPAHQGGTPGRHEHDADVDPHAWQDLSNALRYVDNIARTLAAVDPQGAAVYAANAASYKAEISALDSQIRKTFGAIPAARRKVVTTHDAFSYFGRAYGIEFISPVGVNTDAEPSAADVGRIIQQIRREKIPAVFIESISDPRLLERIRQESGARVGGVLYSDSLSRSDGPAPNYLALMRHNARTLAAALGN